MENIAETWWLELSDIDDLIYTIIWYFLMLTDIKAPYFPIFRIKTCKFSLIRSLMSDNVSKTGVFFIIRSLVSVSSQPVRQTALLSEIKKRPTLKSGSLQSQTIMRLSLLQFGCLLIHLCYFLVIR